MSGSVWSDCTKMLKAFNDWTNAMASYLNVICSIKITIVNAKLNLVAENPLAPENLKCGVGVERVAAFEGAAASIVFDPGATEKLFD